MKGISADITRVDVTDELALREVFFGEGVGKDYAVLCHTPHTPGTEGGPNTTKKPLPISSVFQDAADETTPAEFVLLDCNYVLPSSGKSVAERFKLDLDKRPTVFVSGGKAGPPKQVPSKHLKTGHMLAKLLRSMLVPHAAKVENTRDLKSKCLEGDVCALLIKGGLPPSHLKMAVKNLLVAHPDIKFASVDGTVLLLSNLEEHLPEHSPGRHRFVVFKKVSGGVDDGNVEEDDTNSKKKETASGRLVTSILPLLDGEPTYNNMDRLIHMAKKNVGGTKIPALPQVKPRTKKFEEAERKKRERLTRQKEDKQQKQQPLKTPGGMFTENDGSKEGRKAERDRRREEHNKNNPDYKEKTPEEIAAIERERRKRMEEESSKWNIGEADAPPVGDPLSEDLDDSEYVSGDNQGEFDESDETEEFDLDGYDEEEDVLDLD